jgi:transposase-like protein
VDRNLGGMNELKNRDVEDVLIAVVDGLKVSIR